jgi:hypothetical protein
VWNAIKEKIIAEAVSPTPWLERVQAFAYCAYGMVILGSNGTWLKGELSDGEPGNPAILAIGAVMLIFGVIHWYGIIKVDHTIRMLLALASTLMWSAFFVFYLTTPLHKIGSVACLCFLLMQLKSYLWIVETKRRERVVKTARADSRIALHDRRHIYIAEPRRGLVESK